MTNRREEEPEIDHQERKNLHAGTKRGEIMDSVIFPTYIQYARPR